MTSRRFVFLLLGSLTFLRLLLIGSVELAPDEAYYTMWSQYPDLSYYSKGPGVAATIWVSTHLFGTNEFGVRFFSPLLALGTSLLMYGFARRLYGEAVALWTVVLMNVLPIFLVGSVLMTIDPLSIFFWTAALVAFWRALEEAPGFSWWWPATGALIGLGFLCKWTNALQLLSIVLLLVFTRRHRGELRRAGFWTMLGVFALCTIPPIVWNVQHDWITLDHLRARGGFQKESHANPGMLLTFLGEHLLVYSPLVCLGMLFALWRGWGLMRNHFKSRFLLAFALPVLALYVIVAFRGAWEANWTAPAMPTLGLLAVVVWMELAQERRWARVYAVAALALGAVIGLLFLDSDVLRMAGIPLPYAGDPASRLRGWESSAATIAEFRKQFETKLGHSTFLIADKYQTAAELGFYLKDKRPEAPGHPAAYLPESQAMENQFSFWPRYDEIEDLAEVAQASIPETSPGLRPELAEALAAVTKDDKMNAARTTDLRRRLVQALQKARPQLPLDESFVEEQGVSLFAGRDALYVTDRPEEGAPSTIKGGFEKVEMIACLDLRRRNLPLRQWRIFACYNYHGMSL